MNDPANRLQGMIDSSPSNKAPSLFLPSTPPYSDADTITVLENEIARLKEESTKPQTDFDRKENLQDLRKFLIGIPLTLWFLGAFLPWLFRPSDGHFKPVFRNDGSLETVYYRRTTWWGIGGETDYTVEFKHGRAYYTIDGKAIEIPPWKFSGN